MLRAAVIASLLVIAAHPALAQDAPLPLHRQIDAALAKVQSGPAAAVAVDAEFLRRLSLDLIGAPPTPAELREFLADARPEKRVLAVDRLMADPRFALHWAEVLDVMLMERRPDRYVPHVEWIKYLQTAVREQRPWTQLAKDIFTADGTDPATRPAAKFFLDRDAEPHILTRDVGRIFFGVDLQCAQCHDHPLVDHYAQSDYYGLFAFVNRTVLFHDEPAKLYHLGEKGEGNADYQSVFTKDASRSRPRLPGGPELEDAHFPLGSEYVVAPADKVRPVPKASRRALLTTALDGSNAAFNRNFPNRVWANLFGRGLVHPTDWHHPQNPALSAEVLDLITNHFVASGFRLAPLVKELVLTDAYQRAIDPPAEDPARLASVPGVLAQLDAQIAALDGQVKTATEEQDAAYKKMQEARNALTEPDQAYQKSVQAALPLQKKLQEAEKAVAATQQQIAQKQGLVAAVTETSTKAAEAVKLVPTDAELMQVTTILQAKLTAINTEITTLQQTATTQTAAVEAAKAPWEAAVAAAETAYTASITAGQNWEELKKTWNATRQKNLQLVGQLESIKAHRRQWERSSTLAQAIALEQSSRNAVVAVQTELAQAEQRVNEQQVVVTNANTALAAATKELQAAEQRVTVAKQELEKRQGVAKPVSDALADLDVALQKLAADPELTEVQGKLKARLVPLTSAVEEGQTQLTTLMTAYQTASGQQQTAQQLVQTTTAELTTRQQMVATKKTALQEAQTKAEQSSAETVAARTALRETWEREYLSRVEKALTPEQMTYAMLTVTGVLEPQRAAADAEIEKTVPKASVAGDPVKESDRQYLVDRLVRERMRGNVNAFIYVYGAAAGQPQDQFFATSEQALFLANGGSLRAWIAPSGNNLASRLQSLTDASALADELYITVLSRPPRAEETARVVAYLAPRDADRPAAIQELIWALLTSAEFRFSL